MYTANQRFTFKGKLYKEGDKVSVGKEDTEYLNKLGVLDKSEEPKEKKEITKPGA